MFQFSVNITEVFIIMNILYGAFIGLSRLHRAAGRGPEAISHGITNAIHNAQTSGDHNRRSIHRYQGNLCRNVSRYELA